MTSVLTLKDLREFLKEIEDKPDSMKLTIEVLIEGELQRYSVCHLDVDIRERHIYLIPGSIHK